MTSSCNQPEFDGTPFYTLVILGVCIAAWRDILALFIDQNWVFKLIAAWLIIRTLVPSCERLRDLLHQHLTTRMGNLKGVLLAMLILGTVIRAVLMIGSQPHADITDKLSRVTLLY